MIIAFGCSNTYGTSLDNPETESWPYHLNAVNKGIPGASNLQILWNILNYNFNPDDVVITMWTIVNRDYMFPDTQLGVWQTTDLAKDWINVQNEYDSIVKSWLYIDYANLYLQSKQIKSYNFAVDYDLLNKHKPKHINTTLLDAKVDRYKFLDRAKDKMHPGPKAHKNISDRIKTFI